MSSKNPNFIERIVCLANSRKTSGRCIAGKRTNDKTWFRPISTRSGHEISEFDRQYSDGSTAQLFDIIDIPCIQKKPSLYQDENVLIDDGYYWTNRGRASWQDLVDLVDNGADIWANGSSAYYNTNNRVPEAVFEQQRGSLRLLRLGELILHTSPKAPEYENMKLVVRGSFSYQGATYKLDVTDPDIEREFVGRGVGAYRVNSPLVCVSLSEPHTNQNGDTFAYKLIASVITRERV